MMPFLERFRQSKLTLHEAERILADVNPDQCFMLKNGQVIRNLHELERALSNMDESVFNHHVEQEKNDFASWIADVIKDYRLAYFVGRKKNNLKMAAVVRERIELLERQIDREKEKVHSLESDIFDHRDRYEHIALALICGLLLVIAVVLALRLMGVF